MKLCSNATVHKGNTIIKQTFRFVILLSLILVIAACSNVTPDTVTDIEVEPEGLVEDIFVSNSSSKNGDVLDASVVTGNIYVYASGANAKTAKFYLNKGTKNAKTLSMSNGVMAKSFNTNQLSDTTHSITGDITFKAGRKISVTSVFLVDNAGKLRDNILVSTSPTRVGAKAVAGSTVSGKAYFFVIPKDEDIKRVEFYIDGSKVNQDKKPFFDLAGANKDGTAKAFDTAKLKEGKHTLEVIIKPKSGKEKKISASFTVSRSGSSGAQKPTTPTPAPAPEPDPEPEPEPTPTPNPGKGETSVPKGAKIYYVATNGNDKNDGSLKNPFKTLNKAGSVVQPGDVIRVRGGVYYEYNDRDPTLGLPQTGFMTNGTKDKPIIIESYPGEWAIFDGSKLPNGKTFRPEDGPSNPQQPMLLYLPVNHYIVRNMEFRNSVGAAVVTNPSLIAGRGNYNTFSNLVLHDNHGNGLAAHGVNYKSDNGKYISRSVTGNVAEYIISHHNQSIRNGGDSADGIKMSNATKGVIRNSQLYKNSDDGIDFYGSQNMLIESSSAWLNGHFWKDGDKDPYSTNGMKDAKKGDGQGFKMGGGNNEPNRNANNEVRLSFAWQNKGHGFAYNGEGGIIFKNNTSWNNDGGGFAARCYGNHVLINNLSYNERNTVSGANSKCKSGKDPKEEKNSWNMKISDPKFKSTNPGASSFLALDSKSPAIDKGAKLGLWFNGKAPDLGALEYGKTASWVK